LLSALHLLPLSLSLYCLLGSVCTLLQRGNTLLLRCIGRLGLDDFVNTHTSI
jgi:hypothetical protein